MPGRVYVYAAIVLAFAALGWYAHHEHGRAEDWHEKAVVAESANASNADTIAMQTKALNEWKALMATPADLQTLIDRANANEREAASLRGIIARAKGNDRDLPDCIKLLSISLTRACPSVAAGLYRLATHTHDDGGSADPGSEAIAGRDP